MKTLQYRLLWSLVIFMSFSQISWTQVSLIGKVTEHATNEPIILGTVTLYQKDKLITSVETDFDGNYNISNIDAGLYDVEATYVGMQKTRIKGVKIEKDKINKLDIEMEDKMVALDEVVVVDYKIPLIKRDASSSSHISTKSKKKKRKKKETIRGARSETVDYPIDGVRMKTERKTPASEYMITVYNEGRIAPSDALASVTEEIVALEEIEEEAGQITAGEWNDLDNWRFWRELQDDISYNKWQAHWGFYPTQRYAVKVVGTKDQPVVDALVTLLDKTGTVIWETKTDNQGQAELWAGAYGDDQIAERISIQYHDFETNSRNIRTYASTGINHFKIPVDCSIRTDVDIFFAVDATGSMGDEIQFLKAELKDVIQRVKEDNPSLQVRLGAGFYRDQGDAYVTKSTPFSEDVEQTIQFIRAQHADGGGDYPEAVHTALEVALAQDWRKDARSRMLFLLLDAPPHEDDDVLKSLHQSIREAAKMGIKIIPITASGIGKETEFLMKYFSVLTNGTYTFITDHSGIGNPHLAPTAEEYNVETLNELMLRLILENTEFDACDDADLSSSQQPIYPVFSDKIDLDFIRNQDLLQDIQVYPNPAKDHFFLDVKTDFDKVYLLNQQGQLVRSFTNIIAGKTQQSIKELPAGMYVLHFVKGKEMASEKLVLIND